MGARARIAAPVRRAPRPTNGVTQTRTHNAVNEITGISGDWPGPNYDEAGNPPSPTLRQAGMIFGPRPTDQTMGLHLVYDAWGRLAKVHEDDGDTAGSLDANDTLRATYRYDGLHRRVRKIVVGDDGNSTPYDFYHNNRWQVLEVRRHDDTAAWKQYVWDIRYIDAPVIRWWDDDNDGSFEPGDGEVHYYTGGANFNVTALLDANSGKVVERYLYDPYGGRTVLDGNDDADTGVVEWAPDGDNRSDYDNEILYCGYRHDPETGLFRVRNRYLDPTTGSWTTRDPAGYVDGMNLYQYATSLPTSRSDPSGMKAMTCEHVLSVTPNTTDPNVSRWLDAKWVLIAMVPDPHNTFGSEGIYASYPKLIYLRRYVDLFKCCDKSNCPAAVWGQVAGAVGEETPLADAPFSSHKLPVEFPLPKGLPAAVPLGTLGVIWAKGSKPVAPHSHHQPTSEIVKADPKHHVPKGYTLVDQVDCLSPPSWPPPGGIPKPPTVKPLPKIEPVKPGA
ncbi:MAG: RHS repeat-associated core domain-containing protein [Phycisphaerae bacterium]